ncbi:hypothetical protein BROUX41_006221 [Berkeleyomyces rouxiae]|uniref:uncharacterized protein n=1 Tax=Berkeleyomyces rouxiae TaxID=2035830 RepID=UPI003B80D499
MIAVNEVAVMSPPPAPVPSQDPYVLPLRSTEAASPLASPLTPLSPLPKTGPLQMKPKMALELLVDVVDMLLHNHLDIPPSPHDPTAIMTNMRGMEAEKVQIIRSNSERDLARMRQLALKEEQTQRAAQEQRHQEHDQRQHEKQPPESLSQDQLHNTATNQDSQDASQERQTPADADPTLNVPAPHSFSAQHNAITRRFYSKHPPQITARDYLGRLHKYCTHSSGVYIWTALTLFRLARIEGTMQVTTRNVHRLLLAALDVASKALEDHSWPHARIAQVGGVKSGELTRLELIYGYKMAVASSNSRSATPTNALATSKRAMTRKMKQTTSRSGSLIMRVFGLTARLFAWYAIITIIFRCPTSLRDNHKLPQICEPCFRLRSSVTPYVEPYYTAHIEPYVKIAVPYYKSADTFVLTPARSYAARTIGPRLEQVSQLTTAKYDELIRPWLVQYEVQARQHYDEQVAPIVQKTTDTLAPYYTLTKDSAVYTYHQLLVPAYITFEPYAHASYQAASDFTKETALPSVAWALNKAYSFMDSAIWPHIKVVYINNVEPQLARIGKRLGRYKGKQGLHKAKTTHSSRSSTSEAKTSSFIKPPQKPASKTPSPATDKAAATTASNSHPTGHHNMQYSHPSMIEAPEASENESELRHNARLQVAADLREWQERFSKAADEGAAEIDSLIRGVTQDILSSQLMEAGHSLVQQLSEIIESETQFLKSQVVLAVQQKNTEYSDLELFNTHVATLVRQTGIAIKSQAEEVRIWREEFDTQLQAAITENADTHFKTLDTMRDLALQKIGMKWAWMDGITYKDWAKYHDLRARFDEWTDDLKAMIVTHSDLSMTQDYANIVEDQAMDLARAAVKQLAEIKEVAAAKFSHDDNTDDFDLDSVYQRAEEKAAAEAAAEAERLAEEAAQAETTERAAAEQAAESEATAKLIREAESDIALEEEAMFNTQVEHHEPLSTGSELADESTVKDEVTEPSSAVQSHFDDKSEL